MAEKHTCRIWVTGKTTAADLFLEDRLLTTTTQLLIMGIRTSSHPSRVSIDQPTQLRIQEWTITTKTNIPLRSSTSRDNNQEQPQTQIRRTSQPHSFQTIRTVMQVRAIWRGMAITLHYSETHKTLTTSNRSEKWTNANEIIQARLITELAVAASPRSTIKLSTRRIAHYSKSSSRLKNRRSSAIILAKKWRARMRKRWGRLDR